MNKVWHSTDAHRKVIWRCNSKFKGDSKCATPHLDAETNQLMANRESVVRDCLLMKKVLSDCTALHGEINNLNEEITIVADLVKACIKDNATSAQPQVEYTKKYNGLLTRYEKATTRLAELTAKKERKRVQDRKVRLFIETLKKQPFVLEEWDEEL